MVNRAGAVEPVGLLCSHARFEEICRRSRPASFFVRLVLAVDGVGEAAASTIDAVEATAEESAVTLHAPLDRGSGYGLPRCKCPNHYSRIG